MDYNKFYYGIRIPYIENDKIKDFELIYGEYGFNNYGIIDELVCLNVSYFDENNSTKIVEQSIKDRYFTTDNHYSEVIYVDDKKNNILNKTFIETYFNIYEYRILLFDKKEKAILFKIVLLKKCLEILKNKKYYKELIQQIKEIEYRYIEYFI
jgi:hypothetical protein